MSAMMPAVENTSTESETAKCKQMISGTLVTSPDCDNFAPSVITPESKVLMSIQETRP